MSDCSQSNDEQECLKRMLEEANARAQKLAEIYAQSRQENNSIVDWTNEYLKKLPQIPTGIHWGSAINDAQRLNTYLGQQITAFQSYVNPSGTLFYSAGTVSGILSPLSESQIQHISYQQQEQVRQVRTELVNFVERPQYRDQALQQFKRLGFEKTTAGKIAIEKFCDAWSAYLEWSAGSYLLTMRSAIEGVIGELVRRTQKKGDESRGKIIRVLEYSAANHVSGGDFVKLQSRCDVLRNELSGDKNRILDRPTMGQLMVESTLFLIELFGAIDLNKLKS
jgi:hypothetical protein